MKLARFIVAIIAVLPPSLNAQQPAPHSKQVSTQTSESMQKMIGDVFVNGQAYEYDRHLADEIGPRLTGSANYMKAAQWAQQKMQALGLANVHTETFSISAWEPDGPAIGSITMPFGHELHIYSFPGSPSTPKGGISAKVVHVPGITRAEIKPVQDSLRGNFALVDRQSLPANLVDVDLMQVMPLLEEFGVKGILVGDLLPAPIGHYENGIEDPFTSTPDGSMLKVPTAQIGSEDVQLIHRLMEQETVTVTYNFKTQMRQNVDVPQVVGEIPGSQYPDQIVLVGAHLDSWHPGTGAQDNGTGVATVLDVARAIEAQQRAPRRTVRFVLFGGEEQGALGSISYAHHHRDEIDKFDAVLVSDTGSGPVLGWSTMGRNDEQASLQAVEPFLHNIGSDRMDNSTDELLGSDHAPFVGSGVPALLLSTDLTNYWSIHHKASDTFESVSRQNLMQAVVTTALTAYAIADSEDSFARHFSADEVRNMFQESGHEAYYLFGKKVGMVP